MQLQKWIGPILLLLFSSIGFFLITYINALDIPSMIRHSMPVLLVLVYVGVIRLWFLDEENHEITNHYADSPYFLGFILTLIALFNIFYNYDFATSSTGDQLINEVVRNLGIALSTTIVGLIGRNMLKTVYIGAIPNPLERSLEEVNKYSNEFIGYIDSLNMLKTTLHDINEASIILTNQLSEQIDKQKSAMQTTTEGLVKFQKSVSSVNSDLESLGKLSSEINTFNSDIQALKTSLNDFCQMLQKQIIHMN